MLPMISKRMSKSLFRIGEGILRQHITKKLIELKANEAKTAEEINRIHFNKLQKVLDYAYTYSPFYKERLRNVNVSEIENPDELNDLKPLSKDELRSNIEYIKSKRPVSKLKLAKTSGSTGISIVFPKDVETIAYHYAAMYRGHSWYGVEVGDREARLWGMPVNFRDRLRVKILDYCLNRFRERENSLSEEVLDEFYRRMLRFRPRYIMGFGKMLYEFACYLNERGLTLEDLHLRMAKYTSENLRESERALVENTFSCPVVSEYGAAETGIIAFQCPKGRHHIMWDCVHIDYIDVENGPESYKEILVTDLNNYSFPIIRYRLGDLVIPSEIKCNCGLPFPCIEEIYGRTAELFELDGRRYHSNIFYYIMKKLSTEDPRLKHYRVIRKAERCFCYQLSFDGRDPKIEEYITKKTKQELGANIQIEFEYYRQLPREPSGKIRDFIPLANSYINSY